MSFGGDGVVGRLRVVSVSICKSAGEERDGEQLEIEREGGNCLYLDT
jgi:hypothetical protein